MYHDYSADSAMVLSASDGTPSTSAENFRPMDLNIVKNRNGERGVVKLKFYAKHAEFVETGKDELPEDADD